MIRVTELVKEYVSASGSRNAAVKGIGFDVAPGTVVTLLGPSGCGKTTTLRCIAGLERPDAGMVMLGDRTVYSSAKRINVSPDKRDIGMVFQSYAIWPHMTVGENVAYPLRSRHVKRAVVKTKVANALELVGLGHLEDRLAPNLSGGQQQRVALARAIVAEPDVLLLDEPLSNLDAKLRDGMRTELRQLQQRLGLTVCFVTHDQTEALALADNIVLMRDGHIVEEGTPEQLYDAPRDPYTAAFLGSSNSWTSTVERIDGGRAVVANPFGRFVVDDPEGVAVPGAQCALFFRQHNAEVVDPSLRDELGVATATVESSIFLGESLHVRVSSQGVLGMLALPTHVAGSVGVGAELSFRLRTPLLFEALGPSGIVEEPPPGSDAPREPVPLEA